jgi:protein-disulfide isomerase
VYYRSFQALVVALLAAAVGPATARAQVEITVDPNMVKGAPGAPVTIVEFSDYQ